MRFKPLLHQRCVVVHFGNKNAIQAKQMGNTRIHNKRWRDAILFAYIIVLTLFSIALNLLLYAMCEKYKLANEKQQQIIHEYVVQQERKH